MEEPDEQPGSRKDWKIVIADFGLSRTLGEDDVIVKRMGTVQYMAPEMIHPTGKLNEFRVTRCADIWSLGIIFYYLIWGKFPDKHQGERMSEILCNIQATKENIMFPEEFSSWVENLTERLNAMGDPAANFTAEERQQAELLKDQCLNLVLTTIGCLQMKVPARWNVMEIISSLEEKSKEKAGMLLLQKKQEMKLIAKQS